MGRLLRGSFVPFLLATFIVAGCAGNKAPAPEITSKATSKAASKPEAQPHEEDKDITKAKALGQYQEPHPDVIRRRGTLRISVFPDDPPFTLPMKDGSKELEGFAADMGRRMTALMFGTGVKAEFQVSLMNPDFALKTRQSDVVLSRQVAEGQPDLYFSRPYYIDSIRFLVRRGQGISTVHDLAGKRVGYAQHITITRGIPNPTKSEGFQGMQKQLATPAQAENLGEMRTAVKWLHEDRVAAVLIPTSEISQFVAKDSGLTVLSDRLPGWPYGVIMRKESVDLAAVVDKAIQQMTDSGELAELAKKWSLDM
jgi:ABC-type amino acid transport substrate-binding protein